MDFSFKNRLDESIEERIRAFFATLSEKDRRRFAVLESQRFGHGGIAYAVQLLDCSRRTVERGISELTQLPENPAAGRTGRTGGGGKKIEVVPGLEDNLVEALQSRTAGDPDAPKITFTNQSPTEMADRMSAQGTHFDSKTVKKWYCGLAWVPGK